MHQLRWTNIDENRLFCSLMLLWMHTRNWLAVSIFYWLTADGDKISIIRREWDLWIFEWNIHFIAHAQGENVYVTKWNVKTKRKFRREIWFEKDGIGEKRSKSKWITKKKAKLVLQVYQFFSDFYWQALLSSCAFGQLRPELGGCIQDGVRVWLSFCSTKHANLGPFGWLAVRYNGEQWLAVSSSHIVPQASCTLILVTESAREF